MGGLHDEHIKISYHSLGQKVKCSSQAYFRDLKMQIYNIACLGIVIGLQLVFQPILHTRPGMWFPVRQA